MDAQPHVGVERGSGLVARFGDALILVLDPDEEPQATEELLETLASAPSGAGPPGTLIATGLAGILVRRQPEKLPAFGVVAPLADGYVVLLHGPVSAHITTAHEEQRISGDDAVTWVDRKVAATFEWLSVGGGDAPVHADPRSDLRAGAVPGSGFVLTVAPGSTPSAPSAPPTGPTPSTPPSGAPTPTSPTGPTQPVTPTPPNASQPASPSSTTPVQPGPAQPTLAAPPAPASPRAGTTAPIAPADDTAASEFKPALPPRQTIDVAPSGGAAQPGPSGRATEVAAGPVRFLVADDGMRIPLDRSYVLGREPDNDPAVTRGSATPIRLRDIESLISRVHCYITVDAGQVLIRDADSANGTFVAAPGAEAWTQLGPDAALLPPTWSVRVGKRVLTFVGDAATT